MYPDYLDNLEGKNYYCKDGKIFSIEKSAFGQTITHIYIEDKDEWKLQRIWAQFHDIFRAGRRSKSAEIKKAFDTF